MFNGRDADGDASTLPPRLRTALRELIGNLESYK
eukprot:gene1805-3461_t